MKNLENQFYAIGTEQRYLILKEKEGLIMILKLCCAGDV